MSPVDVVLDFLSKVIVWIVTTLVAWQDIVYSSLVLSFDPPVHARCPVVITAEPAQGFGIGQVSAARGS